MIRKLELKDKEAVNNLVEEFHNESLGSFGLSLDFGTVEGLTDMVVDKHLGLVIEEEGKVVGILACLLVGTFFNKNEKICQEIIWYIKKDYRKKSVGRKLFEKMQEECRRLNIEFIIMGYMGNLNAEVMNRFYKMNKYSIFENQFIRRLK